MVRDVDDRPYCLLDSDARYRVTSFPGVAFWYAGDEIETVEEWIAYGECDHDPWQDCTAACGYWSEDERSTGMVYMVMVGDDHRHLVDPADCVPIDRADYCGVCGQIGCSHDGYYRDE